MGRLSQTNITNIAIIAIVCTLYRQLCLRARESFAAELWLFDDSRSILDAPCPVN